VAQLFDDVEDRVHAVVCQGRGTSGMSAEALARAITTAQFRRPTTDASVRDPAYPAEEFDRAVQIEWLAVGDVNEASNEYDGTAIRVARCNVLVGYFAAPALSALARILGSETAAGAVTHWRRRALGDAERIKRALCFAEIAAGSLASTVEWIGCTRDGETTLEELGEGRALSITPLRITLSYPLATAFTP
jgi:hypothetical protein